MAVFGKYLYSMGLLAAAASLAGAQAPKCDVTDALKGNAARASLSVDMARQAGPGPAAASSLKSAIKLLDTPDKSADATAQAYVLGSALSLTLNQPGIGYTPKRSAVGFVTNGDATIDLVGTLDSLFTVVEKAKPACSELTSYWRGGQKFYLDAVNGAINALNADKLDSAESYATLANRIYKPSPYGTMILGTVASKRGNSAKAVAYWSEAAEAADKDTSYRDVRRQMLANIGSVYLANANAASGADRATAARNAAAAYRSLVEVPGTKGSYLSGGRQNYQSALLLAGDTAAFMQSLAPLLASPSAYEYQDLLNSAVNAARATKPTEAARLFEATLAQNPYSRDALFNLAVTYLTLEQNDKVAPIVSRLVAIDPANPENFNLSARAYLSLAKAAEKAKKSPQARAYNDSTLTWYTNGNKLPAEVTVTEFTPGEKLTISGTVLDRRDKADVNAAAAAPAPAKGAKGKAAKPAGKSYPAQPVTLKIDALDKTGAVIGSQSVTTEALTPGKSAKFSISIAVPNAAGYKYSIGG